MTDQVNDDSSSSSDDSSFNAFDILSSIAADGSELESASAEQRNDKEFVLSQVSTSGLLLQFASPELRADKEVVLAAVQDNYLAWEYASADLKADEEMAIPAVVGDRHALKYVDNDNEAIVMAAVSHDGYALQYASLRLKADKEIVMCAAASKPDALKFADASLKQDKDCWKAAELWTESFGDSAATSGEVVKRIALSTRFSLREKDKSSVNNFTVMLNQTEFFRNDGSYQIYSPNAFAKTTCDPQWTDMGWPCRGTFETCRMQPEFKSGTPSDDSCWRYSYRYQLEQAKQSNGFMIQIVDFDVKECAHVLGKGQEIESIMARQVGTKVFRVCQPVDDVWKKGRNFSPRDMTDLIHYIEAWYVGGCDDDSAIEIQFWRRSSLSAGTSDYRTISRVIPDNSDDVAPRPRPTTASFWRLAEDRYNKVRIDDVWTVLRHDSEPFTLPVP